MPVASLPKMLQDLPTDKMSEVRTYLLEGHTPNSVAKIIQSDWGFFKTKKRPTIAKNLLRYKKQHLTEIEILIHNGAPNTIAHFVERTGKMLNALDLQQELIEIAMARVRAGNIIEVEKQTPLKGVREDILTAASVVRDYGNLAMKVGMFQNMTPDEADEAIHGVVVNDLAESVLGQGALKKGLTNLIGSIIEDVKASEDTLDT